jgi:hypothetical protein
MRLDRALEGLCLILFFMFSEPIPFGTHLGDMPIHFTANWFVPVSARGVSMSWLFIPALLSLAGAVLPIFHRRWNWIAFILLLPAAVFYALIWRSREPLGGWYPWLILAIPFFGMNIWVWSVDYFYASAVASLFWDLGAAIIGVRLNLPWIPEPYGPHIAPVFSVVFDLTMSAFLVFLWWKRFPIDTGGGDWYERIERTLWGSN